MVLFSVVLALNAGIVAAIPIRALRIHVGREIYWSVWLILTVFLVALKQYPLAVTLSALSVLIGSFSEFEKRGDHLYKASVCSILTTMIFLVANFALWMALKGRGALVSLTSYFDQVTEQVNILSMKYYESEIITTELKKMLLMNSPSALLIVLMFALYFALLFEKRILQLVQGEVKKPGYQLIHFQIHDILIWAFIISILGNFLEMPYPILKVISVNVFNVSLVLLLFQGLAVMGHFFESFNVGRFWRFLWVFLLVIQLPIFVCLIGLMDYWLNFRWRFAKHAAEIRKSH